jgi:hypothetical protein
MARPFFESGKKPASVWVKLGLIWNLADSYTYVKVPNKGKSHLVAPMNFQTTYKRDVWCLFNWTFVEIVVFGKSAQSTIRDSTILQKANFSRIFGNSARD